MPTIWLAPPNTVALIRKASNTVKPLPTASAPNSMAKGPDATTTGMLSLKPSQKSPVAGERSAVACDDIGFLPLGAPYVGTAAGRVTRIRLSQTISGSDAVSGATSGSGHPDLDRPAPVEQRPRAQDECEKLV